MHIRSLHVVDFRNFAVARTDFSFPSRTDKRDKKNLPNVTLLLGINGAGKTSLLKAIALAVLAPVIQSSGYKPYYLVRREGKTVKKLSSIRAELVLHGQDLQMRAAGEVAASSPMCRIKVRRSYETIVPSRDMANVEYIFDDTSAAYFMVGYGATRRVEAVDRLDSQGNKRRGLRYQRVAGLFEEYITLYPLGAWLPQLRARSRKRFVEIKRLFRALLPRETHMTGSFENNDPVFIHRGTQLPLGALSDGYRAYIGLIGDLLYHLQLNCPKTAKLTGANGIVMVDDIDLHLHPTWQRTVVPCLARTFPHLQFILTSHSAIVAGTLHGKNVRLVEDDKVTTIHERLHGLNVDQILTSSYFNLPSSRSTDTEAELARMAKKVGNRSDADAAIEFLKKLKGEEEGPRP